MKSVYVGEFTEQDLKVGRDKTAVEKAKAETGLQYTNQKFVVKDGKIIAMKIWVCGAGDFEV